jgi:radical SAM superfamily enzyme YgiQ (UPF0313 family)
MHPETVPFACGNDEEGSDEELPERYFRPPSEADSFLIRVMRGCPHNKCAFCNLFKKIHFRPIPLEEVLAGIDADAVELPPDFLRYLSRIYFEGGDPLALRAANLLRIMERCRQRFPAVERFASYATARFTIRKKQEDLDALGRAGYERVYVGLESGCDALLQKMRKGCSSADMIRAGEMLGHAGIEMDVSMMLGVGGLELSRRHALETAEVINAIRPACVRIRTFTPKTETEMGDAYQHGDFQLMEPADILRELYTLVEHLDVNTQLLSEHWTNFIWFNARALDAKKEMLLGIRDAIQEPRDVYRPLGLTDARG